MKALKNNFGTIIVFYNSMKKLFIFILFFTFSFAGFSQEYDDMYFNKRDRKKDKNTYFYKTKHMAETHI